MNTETNQVYWNADDVKAAEERGEPLLPLIPIPSHTMPRKEYPQTEGHPPNRHERRKQAKLAREVHA